MLIKIAGKEVYNSTVNNFALDTIKERIKSGVQEEIKEHVYDVIVGGLKALGAFLYDFSYVVTLIGGGICILMWVMGWKDGFKYVGIAVGVNIMIRILLSGF